MVSPFVKASPQEGNGRWIPLANVSIWHIQPLNERVSRRARSEERCRQALYSRRRRDDVVPQCAGLKRCTTRSGAEGYYGLVPSFSAIRRRFGFLKDDGTFEDLVDARERRRRRVGAASRGAVSLAADQAWAHGISAVGCAETWCGVIRKTATGRTAMTMMGSPIRAGDVERNARHGWRPDTGLYGARSCGHSTVASAADGFVHR